MKMTLYCCWITSRILAYRFLLVQELLGILIEFGIITDNHNLLLTKINLPLIFWFPDRSL